MKKHMDIRDRVRIQVIIEQNSKASLKYLSSVIGVSPSTIYREIIKHRTYRRSKKVVYMGGKSIPCNQYVRFPYVCNSCIKKKSCSKDIYLYDAYTAQLESDRKLRESRRHPYLSDEQLKDLDEKVSPRIKDHQSLFHILQSDPSITISESTLRRYVLNGYLSCMTMDLPMTIRFSTQPKKSYSRSKPIPVDVLNNRTYLDYLDYTSSTKRVTLQLDLVIGKSRDRKAILTIYEPTSKFQWGILIHRSAQSVNGYIRKLISILNKHDSLFFDSVLTDNGSEFQLLPTLEVNDETGEFYFRTFYCDPYSSYQKGGCERNHALFRRLYDKGNSFDFLSQSELDEAFSQINSIKRKALKGKSSYEVFTSSFRINPILLGIFEVDSKHIKFNR